MSLFHKQVVKGIPELRHAMECEDCEQVKQARRSFPSGASRRASARLQLVHMDLCGPLSEKSLGENRYFYLLINDYSMWSWVFFLKEKSEALMKFKYFYTMVERQSGEKLKVIRSNHGGEFSSHEFEE